MVASSYCTRNWLGDEHRNHRADKRSRFPKRLGVPDRRERATTRRTASRWRTGEWLKPVPERRLHGLPKKSGSSPWLPLRHSASALTADLFNLPFSWLWETEQFTEHMLGSNRRPIRKSLENHHRFTLSSPCIVAGDHPSNFDSCRELQQVQGIRKLPPYCVLRYATVLYKYFYFTEY
jgi:hypothetical protein